jgi:hypothetical protein
MIRSEYSKWYEANNRDIKLNDLKKLTKPGDRAVPIATVDMNIDMNTCMSNTSFKFIFMLHAHVYDAVHVHAGCPCPSCMSQYMRRTVPAA